MGGQINQKNGREEEVEIRKEGRKERRGSKKRITGNTKDEGEEGHRTHTAQMKLRKDLAHWPGGPVGEGHKPGDDIFCAVPAETWAFWVSSTDDGVGTGA